mmetsp:Transcript_20698/g.52827  ORF Transcript_20698/g.52827 Transcript_20698/m.52827 type:complete len:414 (+) Transcript_20698:45-1286(+)
MMGEGAGQSPHQSGQWAQRKMRVVDRCCTMGLVLLLFRDLDGCRAEWCSAEAAVAHRPRMPCCNSSQEREPSPFSSRASKTPSQSGSSSPCAFNLSESCPLQKACSTSSRVRVPLLSTSAAVKAAFKRLMPRSPLEPGSRRCRKAARSSSTEISFEPSESIWSHSNSRSSVEMPMDCIFRVMLGSWHNSLNSRTSSVPEPSSSCSSKIRRKKATAVASPFICILIWMKAGQSSSSDTSPEPSRSMRLKSTLRSDTSKPHLFISSRMFGWEQHVRNSLRLMSLLPSLSASWKMCCTSLMTGKRDWSLVTYLFDLLPCASSCLCNAGASWLPIQSDTMMGRSSRSKSGRRRIKAPMATKNSCIESSMCLMLVSSSTRISRPSAKERLVSRFVLCPGAEITEAPEPSSPSGCSAAS